MEAPDNHSCNCGAESEISDQEVQKLRFRKRRGRRMSEIMKRNNNVMPIISGPCFGFAGIFVHELRIVLAKLVLSGKKQEVVEE